LPPPQHGDHVVGTANPVAVLPTSSIVARLPVRRLAEARSRHVRAFTVSSGAFVVGHTFPAELGAVAVGWGEEDKAPHQTPAITKAAAITAGKVIDSWTSQAASAKVTTGNRTNMYELAEAVHSRTTNSIRTNKPADPRVTR